MSILSTLVVGLCILAIFYRINKFRDRKYEEPPLVYYKYPIIGHTWDYCTNIDEFLSKCRKEYGEIFSIYVFGTDITVVGKELGHEVFNSKNASSSAAFEDRVPVARILGLPPNYLNFAAEIAKNVFIGQMHLFIVKTQQSLYRDIDELIGDCDEPKIIQNPRQVLFMIVSRTVTNILVGDKLGHDKDLVDIFMNFGNEFNKLMRIPEYLGFIHPWFFQQSIIRFGGKNIEKIQKNVIDKIRPDIEERLKQERKYGDGLKPPVDCIQFLLNQPGVDKENIDYMWISGQLLAITFVAISTTVTTINNFLLDLASRPEYLDSLLEEQEQINPNNDRIMDLDQISKMKRLDSFLKESLRLSGNILSLIHRVIGPELKFSNGYQVPKGSLIRIYLKNVHHDNEIYGPDSNEFYGYRHLEKESPASKVSRDFLQFGMGQHACPGRNFAVNEIKMFASILIKKYNITIATKSGMRPPNFVINGISFPNPEPLIFEKRVKVWDKNYNLKLDNEN
ncbi:cytochrome P450 [Glomus cerebriforme]|uniref:Cytochrome P450 n=1 Tax=Glomus cerebriforme TaxID=658196 RepID=A0A397TSQ6_9GLOM|nr:cytochrome P450 [Glomus cerebriforme]